MLGVHLCCEAALAAGASRIVITGSGAAYLPGASNTSYTASKAAVCRYAETLNNALEIPVFLFSPGLVRTAMTESHVPADAPWTPPELAPELVRKLATGSYDALAGRYIHAEHDDVDDLLARIDDGSDFFFFVVVLRWSSALLPHSQVPTAVALWPAALDMGRGILISLALGVHADISTRNHWRLPARSPAPLLPRSRRAVPVAPTQSASPDHTSPRQPPLPVLQLDPDQRHRFSGTLNTVHSLPASVRSVRNNVSGSQM